MRVAFVIPSLQNPSGWRTLSVEAIRSLSQYVEPVLLAAREHAQFARTLFPDFSLVALPATQEASFDSFSGSVQALRALRAVDVVNLPPVDLVHSLEAYPTGLVGDRLARRIGCPHIITAAGTYGVVWRNQRINHRVYEGVLQRASLVCPISHGTAQIMQQHFPAALPSTRMHPILIGNAFTAGVPRSWAMERPTPTIPTILSVGDVKARKGQHISLAAFDLVKQQLPNARYTIAGRFRADSSYYQNLLKFITAHQLKDVSILGVISDEELRRQYRDASLFLLTPQQEGLHFEGFGLVYLEAGAYGLPVVGSRSGGVPDAVRDGETGLLAEERDVEGTAAAIMQLLKDPSLAQRMGQANRVWAETLTWERYAGEQAQAYERILAARGGHR